MPSRSVCGCTVAVLLVALGACSEPLCGNRIRERAVSPDNQRIAYVFVRDSGATTGFSTNVAIGALHDAPEDVDVVFTADDNGGKARSDVNALGIVWTQVGWTAPRALSIAHARYARVYRSRGALGDVKIGYRVSDGPYVPPPRMDYFPMM